MDLELPLRRRSHLHLSRDRFNREVHPFSRAGLEARQGE